MTNGYLFEIPHLYYLQNDRTYIAGNNILPSNLAQPLCYLAQKLDSLPWFDYKAHVLTNYKIVEREKGFEFPNLRVIR